MAKFKPTATLVSLTVFMAVGIAAVWVFGKLRAQVQGAIGRDPKLGDAPATPGGK